MKDLWPAAARNNGWQTGDRAKRIAVLCDALGRAIQSASEINDRDDFDAVKRHLLMLADNLAGARETIEPEMGRARRLRDAIRELTRCIAVYIPLSASASEADGERDGVRCPAAAEAYVTQIIRDKFNRGSRVTIVTVDDLTAAPIILRDGRQIPSQLDQLVYTLGACLNGSGKIRNGKKMRLGLRVAASDTLHEMKMKAGVPCGCAEICSRPMVASLPLAETIKEPDPF